MYHRITGYSYLSIVADAFILEGYKTWIYFPRSSVKPFPKECPMGVRNQSRMAV
jgi:hypothetical protein